MDTAEELYSSASDEIARPSDEINSQSDVINRPSDLMLINFTSESSHGESPIFISKRSIGLSKTTIKQEEPEADHDFLYNEAIKAPFKSTSNHTQKAFKIFDQLRKNNILCDVTLKTTDISIAAHKAVLASCSPYFHAMFCGHMCESMADEVIINDVNGSALAQLVNFIYTCEILVTEENVQTLLPAANLLQLFEVKDACCEFLQYQLHPSNCLGIHRFADLHGCQDLLTYSQQYTETHFCDVLSQDEFLSLPVDQLESLISSNRLVATEEQVFNATKKWIMFQEADRRHCAQRLYSYVRFPFLSREFLVSLDDEFMKTNEACKDLLIEALRFHLLADNERVLSTSLQTTPRIPVNNRKILMVLGGQAPKAVRSIEEYDFKTEQWRQVTELPSRRCRCGSVLLKGLIYVVGGFNGTMRVRSVDTYDPIKDQWASVAQMDARRSTLGVAVLDDLIYAVGGFDGSQGLSSAEVYDPSTDLWSPIASMSLRRSSVGLAVLHGLLYVVGGYDGLERECLSSAEVYSPRGNLWRPLPSMSCRRSGAAVAALDGQLYAIGGHDGPLIRDSVERYDPHGNQWSARASMHLSRRNAGVISHGGCLYVVGGDDGTVNLASVECYDPAADQWTLLASSMAVGRSYAAVTLLPAAGRVDD